MLKKITVSPLLKVKEVADRLSVGISTVYRLIRSGEIPSINIGRLLRIDQEDLELYIKAQKGLTRFD